MQNSPAGRKTPQKPRFMIKHMDRWLITWEVLMCLVCFLAGLGVIAFIYPFEGMFQYGMGLLLGGACSVVKIILMQKSLEKTLDMEANAAETRGKLHVALRYFFTVGAVVPAILFRDIFGVVGLIVGLLSLQAAALIASRFPMRGDTVDAKGFPLTKD